MRLILPILYSLALYCLCYGDDSPGPGFFLKVTKNVPRLGRRSENFFTKNSRTIPRIGRSDDLTANGQYMHTDISNIIDWLNVPFSINKRSMMSATGVLTAQERELSVVQPVNSNTLIELLSQDAIPSDNVKFVHWKDFDRALQSDMDLYAKVISLGRKPDQRLKEDLGFSTYVPVSFFNPSNRQNYGENYFNKLNDELYSDKYRTDMHHKYNDLK